jgi:hypothetical protein
MTIFTGSKGIYMYAMRTDYEPVLRAIEAKHRLQYVLTGLFQAPTLKVYRSGLDIENLGIALKGDSGFEPCYMVLDASIKIEIRAIPQRRGGTRYAVDNDLYPSAITFWPGGRYDDKHMIQGEVGTGTDDPDSIALYRLFAREIKKRFTRIRNCWLGPEALQFLDNGGCLTPDVERSPDYCLKRTADNTYY